MPWAVLAGRGTMLAGISFPSSDLAQVLKALPGSKAQCRRCGGDRGSPRAYLVAAATDRTTTGILAALLLPPCRSPPVLALAQPPHTGLGRSRLRSPRAPAFRAGPGAPPPKLPKLSYEMGPADLRPPPPRKREPGAREGSTESAPQGLGWPEGNTSRHLKGKLLNFAATHGKSLSQKQPPLPVHTAR